MTFDPIVAAFGGSNLTLLSVLLWRVIRASGQVERIMRDFPPHRHVGGSIIYPTGYKPGDPVEMADIEDRRGLQQ